MPLILGSNILNIETLDKFNRTNSNTRNVTLQAPPVFTYDANGNTTSNGTWTYTWSDENRLIEAVKTNDKKLTFTYDDQGRRRVKKVYNWTGSAWNLDKHEKYVWNQWNKVAVLDGVDAVKKTMIWGLDIVGSLTEAGGVGALLAINTGSDSCLPAYDGNGNVTAYFDSADNITATFEYKPFGGFTLNDDSLNLSDIASFSTKPYDSTLDATMYELRILKDSRWLSRDPIGERGGINLYAFVSNNPANNWDVLGAIDCNIGEETSDWKTTSCGTISTSAKVAIYDIVGGEVGLTIQGKFCNCCNKKTGETRDYDYIEYGAEAYFQLGFGMGAKAQIPVIGKYEYIIKGPQADYRYEIIKFIKKCGDDDYSVQAGLSLTAQIGGSAGASAWLGVDIGYNAALGVKGYAEGKKILLALR